MWQVVRGIASSSAIGFLLLAFCNRFQHTALVQFRTRYFWNRFRRPRMEGDDHRSGCPIYLSLEVFGDKWSLLILRDMMFGGKRHFRELLRSEEGISSNILADRLRKLLGEGMITRADDPSHKQKAIYSLTEKSIALVPVFAHLGAWGRRRLPASEELSVRARVLEEGGSEMWERFMAELREEHLGLPPGGRFEPGDGSVAAELQAAYEEVLAGGAKE
ncbi:MAG TPA: helix-turn-helix domain-containing protein [Thermoleophilaceae bacterium]|nr:helix-turn-helix domain-containing protein [Thermoleophilaceae bacterium]